MSYIVLKFDDLSYKTSKMFLNVHEFCKEKKISSCFGLIGSSLNNASLEYIELLHKFKKEDVELWNHGYIHSEKEFSKTIYNQQFESIQYTQDLMKEYLGEPATAFGSPHNNSTEVTIKVLRDGFAEIENYFFMVDAVGETSAKQLVMRCNYEIETGVVDLDFFHNEYERVKNYPYFVMQGHPSFWKEEDFARFKEIINILIEDGNNFVTAKELSVIDISGFVHKFSKSWEKDLFDFFVLHNKIVLYGAGEIGREVYRFLKLNGIKPDAFVVSDGHRTFDKICETSVYEMSDAKKNLQEFAIVPALLGKNHESIFGRREFEGMSIWKQQNGIYDEFIDYVRYVVSVDSWK